MSRRRRRRPVGIGIAVLVVVATVLVAVGVGQGSPPHKLPISAAARAREVRVIAHAGHQVKRGEQLFDAHGCDACHTMAAGGYGGRLGPRLDVQTQGDKVSDVLDNITHPPDDDKGYEAGLMPGDYGSRLPARDLHALAAYIHAAASAAKG